MAAEFDDMEVVADSEEEGDDAYPYPGIINTSLLSAHLLQPRPGLDTSTISSFTHKAQTTTTATSISSFSADTLDSVKKVAVEFDRDAPPPRSRPRPIPRFKGAKASTTNTDHNALSPINTNFTKDEDEDDEESVRLGTNDATRQTSSEDIIELTSSSGEDELALAPSKPNTKTKPKPKPKSKPPASSHHSIPLPTSSSSFLPPSDPLPPSSTMDMDHPPIACLSNLGSSPSPPPKTNKRKHRIDELYADVDTLGMPPPTFFASSTSSLGMPTDQVPDEEPITTTTTTKKKTKKEPKPKNTNTTTDTDSKPKRKRKKGTTVEVVIKRLPTAEKVQYKSKEFIDDEDDEDDDGVGVGVDPLLLVGSNGREVDTLGLGLANGDEATSVNAVVYVQRPSKGKKRKAEVGSEGDLAKDEDERGEASPIAKKSKSKGKVRRHRVVESDGEDEEMDEFLTVLSSVSPVKTAKGKGKEKERDSNRAKVKKPTKATVKEDEVIPAKEDQTLLEEQRDSSKENQHPYPPPKPTTISTPKLPHRSHTIIKSKSTPMSELIRRLSSPFPSSTTPSSRPNTPTSYSPYLKSSRSLLSKIAPLHPNRRTPPPPLPRAPKKAKTKKELMMEEKWEEELSESVDGWACLTDEERRELRRAKREREMGGWED